MGRAIWWKLGYVNANLVAIPSVQLVLSHHKLGANLARFHSGFVEFPQTFDVDLLHKLSI